MCVFLAFSMLTVYYGTIGTNTFRHPLLFSEKDIENATGAMFLLMMLVMFANALCNFLVF